MKQLYRVLLVFVFTALSTAALFAQNADQLATERINASYLLAMGRLPNAGELAHWKKQGAITLSQLVENHRTYLSGDASMKRALIVKAFYNSYGRNPVESEIQTNMGQKMTYAEWMINHVNWLKKSSTDYTDVIKRAYKAVMGRDPQPAEITYFRGQAVMSYMILAATLENWRASNGTAAKTSGSLFINTNSGYLQQTTVSATVAREANGVVAAGGMNVIAPGGGNVVSAGGGNVVAAGGMN